MIIYILIFAGIVFAGTKMCQKNEFNTDYCSPKNTGTINAICSILIFFSHAYPYFNTTGAMDMPYRYLKVFLTQLVVVPYLFFSGYGIMESIKKKGESYIKRMPLDRLFKTWYHFAIAILMFLPVVLGFCGKNYGLKQVLLSFTGYTSVGNSNWYMFVTFVLYIIVIFSFLIFRKCYVAGAISTCILSVAFVILEIKIGLPERFYNTLLCFALGMVFSLIKKYIDKLLMKNDIIYGLGLGVTAFAFYYFQLNRSNSLIHYILLTFTAMALVLELMMKLSINSSILDWFSRHIFSFFMLQRIPMLMLSHIKLTSHPVVFLVLSFFATVVLATIFDAAMEKMDSLIFRKKKVKAEIKA